LIVVIAAFLYVRFSPDRFASALRAQIPFLQGRAADAVDSVEARTSAAQAAQRGTVAKGRAGLYAINTQLAEIDVELNRVNDEITDDKNALALAHKKGDREAFDTLVAELNRDTARQNVLVDSREAVVASLKNLEVAVDEQREKEEMIRAQAHAMVSKAKVNDIIGEINEISAGLNDNGADAHMNEAQKILDKTTARANASQKAAEGLTDNERAEKKAAAYIAESKKGNTGVAADDLWAQMSTTEQKTS
jgi:hypothetical protein